MVSPEVFRLAGAEVVEIGTAPDGLNINDGYGSTHLDPLKAAVGRAAPTSASPTTVTPTAAWRSTPRAPRSTATRSWASSPSRCKERGALAHDTLVATVMSNLGLLQAMEREGIRVLQTGVGDRYVLEEMRAGGYSLGGEQSGHVILLDHGTTGDGVLTGLMLAARVAATGRSIADLGTVMTRLPQVLVNVKGVDKSRVESDEGLRSAIAPRRPRSTAPAACCCASPAPSRSCGSWSRRRRRSRRMPSRPASPGSCGSASPSDRHRSRSFAGTVGAGGVRRSAGELGLDVAGDLEGCRRRR